MIEEFKRPISLVEATMEGIRSSIIKGELALGQQLTESYLAELFGLSKTPIREALALLKSEGLVVSEVHKGFRVFKMDEKELSEFCELRFALESQALSSTFTKNRLNLVRKLKNIIKEMEECTKRRTFSFHNKCNYGDIKNYDLLDTKFHKLFFILSSNRYLLKHYESIIGIIETIRTHTHNDNYNIISSLNDHKIIFNHVVGNSISKAKNALDNHINDWINDRVKKSRITK